MTCRDIHKCLSAYLDGELSRAAGDAFFAHLQNCESCCDLVGEAAFTETALAVTLKRRMEAPAAIRMNVLSALSREAARPAVPAWSRWSWRPAATMAAVLALGSAGWRTFTDTFQPATTPATEDTRVQPERAAAVPHSFRKSAPTAAPRRMASALKPLLARPFTPAPLAAPRPKPSPTPPPSPIGPLPAPVTPPDVDPKAVDAIPTESAAVFIGTVSHVDGALTAEMDGSTQSSIAAPGDRLRVNSRMKSEDNSVATLELNDGTVLKSNQHTEFVVMRSPTKDEPYWVVRLVRGELWAKAKTDVKIIGPSMEARTAAGEFSIRSMDGLDTTVLVASGHVDCRNDKGNVTVDANAATVAVADTAPKDPFAVADPKSQLEWAYAPPAPAPAHNPLNDGGTQA